MSPNSPRPIGVTIVAVLMIIGGILGILGGIISMVGAGQLGTVTVEGTTMDGTALIIFGVIALAIGVLNILFAIGILRGSNAVRVIVTILQLLSIGSGIYALTTGGSLLQTLQSLVLPVLIVVLLWVGEKTKAFFAKG